MSTLSTTRARWLFVLTVLYILFSSDFLFIKLSLHDQYPDFTKDTPAFTTILRDTVFHLNLLLHTAYHASFLADVINLYCLIYAPKPTLQGVLQEEVRFLRFRLTAVI